MKESKKIPDNLLMDYGEEIREIFHRAVQHALWKHKQLGQAIAVSRNGQVVIIQPEDIQVTNEEGTGKLQ